jgi:hypothetical protein
MEQGVQVEQSVEMKEAQMSETTYNLIAPDHRTSKGTDQGRAPGVPLEDAARKQLLNAAQLPFIFKWIAAMPDAHWGIGATVGSVIPTKGRDHSGRRRCGHRLRHDGCPDQLFPAARERVPTLCVAKETWRALAVASHGAGPAMSRNEAKRRSTVEDHNANDGKASNAGRMRM